MLLAEKALLGSLLTKPDNIYAVGDIINADSFYATKHQAIYRVIEKLVNEGWPVDFVTVHNELEKVNADVSRSEIVEIANSMPTGYAADYYAQIVSEQSTRRRVETALKTGLYELQEKGRDIKDVLSSVYSDLETSTVRSERVEASVYPEIVDMWERQLNQERTKDTEWIATGLHELDRQVILGKGKHAIIGASPQEGKTALAVQIVRKVALDGKRPLFFSLEESKQSMMQRIISQEARLCHQMLISNRLTEAEKTKVTHTTGKWANANMCILDSHKASWDVPNMKLRAVKEKKEKGLDAVIIDALSLIERPPDLPREAKTHQIYNHNARLLQKMSVDLDVPVITMHHLNRDRYRRPGARPIVSDLREAGEMYASIVIFIYREYLITHDPALEAIAELLIAKNREGQTGSVTVGWDGPSMLFYNIDKHHSAPPGPQERAWDEVTDKEEQKVLGGGIQ